MIVLILRNPPSEARGYVRRFLTELDSNVYVGKITRRVEDFLWERITSLEESFSALAVISDSSIEQGFRLRIHQSNERTKFAENYGILLFTRIYSEKDELK